VNRLQSVSNVFFNYIYISIRYVGTDFEIITTVWLFFILIRLIINIIYIYIYFKYFTVSWNPTSSIKFHANLTLECRIESTERGIPKWSGGYSNHILTFNRASYYKEKYLVELNMQQMLYNLTILDFNEHDVNVLYTCYYGFEQYSKNLTLDNGNFKSTYLFELF
jgi:hypothetical protein